MLAATRETAPAAAAIAATPWGIDRKNAIWWRRPRSFGFCSATAAPISPMELERECGDAAPRQPDQRVHGPAAAFARPARIVLRGGLDHTDEAERDVVRFVPVDPSL